ncbi:inositol monophosphatase family protein [Cytobacillus sp. IB215665]|uniref:inositol monophosphatase family protein n=1 Tax=Cytobacillus sp. IB215665 TaxID=3097357 RepID=UPI002A148F04|nr:inositol monophosphatase family protein [Cytobacillus sp. IB215665]MDX8364912.1 inositol monophosphatase family protein [Cytobacillus sp. IB215665]
MSNNWDEIDQSAKKWIKEAGTVIRNSFTKQVGIHTKSNPNDLVTDIDREIEQFFIKKINNKYATHYVLGEEGFGNEVKTLNGTVWIIDPIDGTINFVHQQRNFCISIGIYENGVGMIGLIYDVVSDELFHARKGHGAYLNNILLSPLKDTPIHEAIIGINATWVTENWRIDHAILSPIVKDARGTRSYGSAALEMAYVAAGRLDGYITMRLSPWDFAAGIVILNEVGGVVTTVKGEEISFLEENSIFASSSNLHNRMLQKYKLNEG